jgi:hypothetical protein
MMTVQFSLADLGENTLATATALDFVSGGFSVSDFVGKSDLGDWYKFTLSAAQTIELSIGGMVSPTHLDLKDANGQNVGWGTLDSDRGKPSSLSGALAAGTYYLRVNASNPYYYIDSDTPYTLALKTVASLDGPAAHGRASATSLGTLSTTVKTVADRIDTAAGPDVYTFTLSASTLVNLRLNGFAALSRANLRIVDAAGNEIASTSAADTGDGILRRQLAAGTYYVEVLNYDGSSTPYSLSAWTGMPAVGSSGSDQAGSSIGAAKSLGTLTNASISAADYLSDGGDTTDFYKFVLSAASRVSLYASGLPSDAGFYLNLYDASGNGLGTVYNAEGSASNVVNLAAGTYYVSAEMYSGSSGYRLQVAASSLPNSVGRTRATATSLGTLTSTEVTKTDWVGTILPNDFYSFTLTGTSLVSLRLAIPDGAGSASFIVTDSAGNEIGTRGWNDNGGTWGGYDTSLRLQDNFSGVLKAGTYYVQVTTPDSSKNYSLIASAVAGPDGSAGSTLATATALGTLTSTAVSKTDWIGAAAPSDHYSFKLTGAARVTLNLSGLGTLYTPYLTIVDGGGNEIAAGSAFGETGDEQSVVVELGAGTYYVRLEDNNSAPATGGAYTLTAVAATISAGAGGKTRTAATTLPGGITAAKQTLTDMIGGVAGTDDWYKFTLASTQSVNFLPRFADYVAPPGTSLQITITDSAGNEIDQFYGNVDANGDWSPAAIDLAAGTYYVHVNNGGARAAYSLTYWTGKPAGGSPAAADGAGNDFAAARDLGLLSASPASAADWVGKSGSTTDARDVYAFTLGERGIVALSLAANSLSTDGSIYTLVYDLYDAKGPYVTSGHTNYGDGNVDEDNLDLGPGTYYVVVRPGAATDSVGYTIEAKLTAPLPDAVGDDFVSARDLGSIGTAAVSVNDLTETSDFDFYRFSLGSQSTISLTLATAGDSDLRVVIFAADGSVVEERRYDANGAPVLKVNLAAGDYYVRIDSMSGRDPYSLQIAGTAAASPAPAKTPGSDITHPETLGTLGAAALTAKGWIGDAAPSHVYSFALDKVSLVNLAFAGQLPDSGYATVSIRDAANSMVWSGLVDLGKGIQTEAQLAAGTYFVTVDQYSSAEDNGFALTLSATAVDGPAGHTLATATTLTPTATAATVTDWAGAESDVYKFSMAAAGKLNVTLAGSGYFRILDAAGTVVADDQWGAATASISLAAGNYYLLVDARSSDINAAAGYSLTYWTGAISVGTSASDSAGSSISTAFNLGTLSIAGTVKSDWIGAADQSDYYKFSISKASTVEVNFSGMGPDAGLAWAIRDSSGNVVSDYWNYWRYEDGWSPSVDLAAGTYYLDVSNSGTDVGYRVKVSATPLPDAAGKTLAAPKALGTLGTTPVTVSDAVYNLPSGSNADYYSFTLTGLSTVKLKLSNIALAGDWRLDLLDAAGNVLKTYDASVGQEPTIIETLGPGSYRLALSSPNVGTKRYTLSASATAGPDGPASHSFTGATALPELTSTPTQLAKDWVGINDGLGQANGLDYYKFTLTSAARVTFDFDIVGLSGPTGQIGLLDADGNEIVTDFPLGSEHPGSVSASLAAGTYVVRVSTYWGGNQLTYRLVGSAVPTGDGPAGHDIATALSLSPTAARQSVNDWIGEAARTDFYKITLTSAATLNLALDHDGSTAINLAVLDGALNAIASLNAYWNDETDGLSVNLEAGTYYVKADKLYATDGAYTLTYWTGATTIGTIADTAGNTVGAARDLGTIGATASLVKENVGGSDAVDYFKFTVGAFSQVNFDIDGANAQYRLKLYDAAGNEVETIGEAYGYGTDKQYKGYYEAGTYYVGVTTSDPALAYSFAVTGVAVPAGPGHTLAAARDFGRNPGPVAVDDVLPGSETDYFHFSLSSATFVDLTVIARAGGADIRILGANGVQIGSSFNANSDSPGRFGAMLAAGDYYIELTGTIVDITRYTLQLNPNALTVSAPVLVEGNGGTANLVFTVSLAAESALPVTFSYATGAGGTALAGSDFAATSGTITIAPGETSATISIPVSGDTLYEADETVQLTLSDASGATFAGGAASLTATGTIKNDDAPPVATISSPSVTEGNSGNKTLTFTVTLSAASGLPATFSFATSNGTAASSDYNARSGTLTIAAGQTTGTISVTVLGDTRYEANETVRLTLTNPTGATFAGGGASLVGTGTITNDDAKPVASISNVSLVEGAAGTVNLVYTVTLSAVSGLATTIAYATSDGSATAGSDYAAKTGTLTIAAGQTTGTITVAVNGDALYEADETVTMTLSSPSGASFAGGGATLAATGTIVNDDAPPVLSIGDAVLVEGNSGTSNLVFTVTLSAASGLPVTVGYATADGTALTGSDYAAATGTLTIAAGQTTGTIVVPVSGDTVYENDETLSLVLSGPTGATLAGGASTVTAQGMITNDDAKPVATISSPTVTEGNSGTKAMTFTITLSEVSSLPTSFSFATSNGTATSSDYTAKSGTVTIAAGQKTGTVTVNVTGDTRFEGSETVRLTLTNPIGASFAGAAASIVGTGTISNDDAKPTLSISDVSIVEGNAGTTNMVFTVQLSAVSGVSTSVKFATSDGTATAGSDYVTKSGTLTIAAGQSTGTITVAINGDKTLEPDETFNLTLSAPTNATLAGGAATLAAKGTIVNDEFAPPTLTASAVTLEIYDSTTPPAPVAPPALSSLVSVSTQPGDTIQSYQLIDTNAAANSATISVGGVKQAAGTTISLTPTEFAAATVVAGTSGTSDTVFVRATGVGGPSGWAPLVVTTSVNGAPVLSVADKSVAAGSTLAASALATVTTPVPVVAYEFLDLNPDASSGSFKVGGVTQSAGAIIDILSSQLATTSFVAGATGSSDEIWVRASNGTNWSQWSRFSVTAGALAA